MKNEEAIKVIQKEAECVRRAANLKCNRECEKCDLLMSEHDIITAYGMAIEALLREKK